MPKARALLERIHAVSATKKITQAMKMVSVAKLGKVKSRAAQQIPYIDAYLDLFKEVTHRPEGLVLPQAFVERPLKRLLLICMTTDKGLCGAFNQHIFHHVLAQYKAYTTQGISVDILPIGTKGLDLLKKRGYPYIADYVNIRYDRSMEDIDRVAHLASLSFDKGTYDLVKLIYQPSRVATRERVRVSQLLPLASPPMLEDSQASLYAYEPSPAAVVQEMLPNLIRLELYKAWLLASVAEETMRMLFTSQATDNADKLIRGLRIAYNRVRQSAITRSLTEMLAALDATH